MLWVEWSRQSLENDLDFACRVLRATRSTKAGKIKSSDNVEGTYELAGETLKVKLGGKTVTWTIVRLDAAGLVLEVGKMPVWDGDDAWRMRYFEKK